MADSGGSDRLQFQVITGDISTGFPSKSFDEVKWQVAVVEVIKARFMYILQIGLSLQRINN